MHAGSKSAQSSQFQSSSHDFFVCSTHLGGATQAIGFKQAAQGRRVMLLLTAPGILPGDRQLGHTFSMHLRSSR